MSANDAVAKTMEDELQEVPHRPHILQLGHEPDTEERTSLSQKHQVTRNYVTKVLSLMYKRGMLGKLTSKERTRMTRMTVTVTVRIP